MFKTDKSSLEALSFLLDEQDIVNYKSIIERLISHKLLAVPLKEAEDVIKSLNKVGSLKLKGKVYAFQVYDSYAEGCQEGVELYMRNGNSLSAYFQPGSRDLVYQAEEAVEFLNKQSIKTVYTGKIPTNGRFLGLQQTCDPEDPIIISILPDSDIREFESGGIKVITLDSLI